MHVLERPVSDNIVSESFAHVPHSTPHVTCDSSDDDDNLLLLIMLVALQIFTKLKASFVLYNLPTICSIFMHVFDIRDWNVNSQMQEGLHHLCYDFYI